MAYCSKPGARWAGSISKPQGRVVGRPYSSWLNQLPSRPMAWATAIRGHRVGQSRVRDPPADEPRTSRPARRTRLRRRRRDRLPDEQHSPRVHPGPDVVAEVGQHVVDAGSRDAHRDRPDEHRLEALRSTATIPPAPHTDDPGGDDPGDKAERIDVDGERSQLKAADRRARDSQGHGPIFTCSSKVTTVAARVRVSGG